MIFAWNITGFSVEFWTWHLSNLLIGIMSLLWTILVFIMCYGQSLHYTKDQLIAARPASHQLLSTSTWSIIKDLWLSKVTPSLRGCRAGSRKQRLVNSIVTTQERSTTYHRQHGVQSENLIPVKRQGYVPERHNKFTLCLVNTRSVKGPAGKTEDTVNYVLCHNVDVCIITETWLTEKDTVTKAALQPQGYKFKDCPRSVRRGGGIGIMFKEGFNVTLVTSGSKPSFQYAEWILAWQNNRIRLVIVYHPPYSKANPITNSTFLDEFEEDIETVVLCTEPLCIAGDFNLHMDIPSDIYQQRMSNILVTAAHKFPHSCQWSHPGFNCDQSWWWNCFEFN